MGWNSQFLSDVPSSPVEMAVSTSTPNSPRVPLEQLDELRDVMQIDGDNPVADTPVVSTTTIDESEVIMVEDDDNGNQTAPMDVLAGGGDISVSGPIDK